MIVLVFQDFLQAKQMHIDLVDFSRSCEAEVLVIMAMVILADDQPLRQLAVYSASRIYREQVSRLCIGEGASELNPRSPNLCSVAVVDGVYTTCIFIQCSCLIAPCMAI